MNGDITCPYCGNEFKDEDWWEITGGDGAEVEMECPLCEKEFKATLYISTDAWFDVDDEDFEIEENK